MRESPAQPAQSTACFLHASAPSAEFQNVQLSISLGEACPAARVRQAWQQVITHYGVLRSSFVKIPTGEFLYREHDGIEGSWQFLDWSKTPPEEVPRRWAALLEEDAAQAFDLAMPPLVRFVAIELPAGHCHLLMTYPKVLLDEDALLRVLCAWLGALEGALPLDVEEKSRRFEESPVRSRLVVQSAVGGSRDANLPSATLAVRWMAGQKCERGTFLHWTDRPPRLSRSCAASLWWRPRCLLRVLGVCDWSTDRQRPGATCWRYVRSRGPGIWVGD